MGQLCLFFSVCKYMLQDDKDTKDVTKDNTIDKVSHYILQEIGLVFETTDQLNGQFIPRELFINNDKYLQIKEKILELKNVFSSSFLTCLHSNALKKQRFPLLNLIRQILSAYHYKMVPIRKSNGYTKDGIKLYKRFFTISKIKLNSDVVSK
jgi:hypothetical protein